MNWKSTLLLCALVMLGCQQAPPVRDQHRMTFVASRGPEEAYDATVQVLTQNFSNLDPSGTSRDGFVVLTQWRQSEEPDRLARTRARSVINARPGGSSALVELFVERQFSTKKTEYGELDRKNPQWIGGVAVTDSTLENQLLTAIEQRLKTSR